MVDMMAVQKIVREAAKLFANREEVSRIKEKGAYDFVTAVDEAVQSVICKELEKLYPQIQFMGEEESEVSVDLNGLLWILDPVDGTTNLIHDYKNSAISLGLMENREVIAGIIYDPYLDEMYCAKKGEGCFLNGEKIQVSKAQTMSQSLIAIGTSPYRKEEAADNFRVFEKIYMDCQDLRRTGSAALDMAHVACGRIEGYIEKKLKLWDFAAGTLIVREAGGKVLDYEGNDRTMELMGDVVVGNAFIAPILAKDYL
ncbi:MAG: inositol monophosphatase [Lachnospiraceae bacterium]|nr:inositol monophosphatase [Lachnospiraceae bacterium]